MAKFDKFGLLSLYFDERYGANDMAVQWYVDPAPNVWKFELFGETHKMWVDEVGDVHDEIISQKWRDYYDE